MPATAERSILSYMPAPERHSVNPSPDSGEAPRCSECGERIGVYEPMVWFEGDVARVTSRAAEPDLTGDGRVFHAACYWRK